MLVVDNLACSFSSESQLRGRGLANVAFNVGRGEFVALMGRNGSGKSTILKIIAGIRGAEKGSIRLGSLDLGSLSAHRRARYVSLIGQNTGIGLPQRMSLGEVLALCTYRNSTVFTRLQWRKSKKQLADAVGSLLPHLGFRLEDQICTLSGGELQLLSLVCVQQTVDSLNSNEHVLLLDEHVASLDSMLAKEVVSISRDLTRTLSLDTLVVLHSISLAREFADRILVLDSGTITKTIDRTFLDRCTIEDLETALYCQSGDLVRPTCDSGGFANEA